MPRAEVRCLAKHMNFFKRAVTSITRRPGKTIILLLLVFILGTVIAGAISVRGAIGNTDANLRARMQPIVAISQDHEAFREYLDSFIDWDNVDWDNDNPWNRQPRMTPAHVRAIGNLDYVSFYDFMIVGWMRSFDVSRYWGDQFNWAGDQRGMPESFTLRGTSNSQMVQFESGVLNMVDGRQFNANELLPATDQSAVLVSREFAQHNNLGLGSTFNMGEFVIIPYEDDWGGINTNAWDTHHFLDENMFGVAELTFTVIGIFEVPEGEEDEPPHVRSDALNTLYVPNWAIEEVTRQSRDLTLAAFEVADIEMPDWMRNHLDTLGDDEDSHILSFFIVENPSYIDDFRAAAEPLMPDFHTIEDMSSSFDDIASSMATMETISFWVLWVSIGATLLILSLLITLFLRDRRYEMGVYLALCEKKGNIITQILLEVVATAFIGITFAVFSGHLISSVVSDNMVRNELQAAQNQGDDWGWGGGMWQSDIFDQIGIPNNDMSITEMAEAFQVRLGVDTILMFYGVGLGAVVLSTLFPVIYVVTLKPKKVLM